MHTYAVEDVSSLYNSGQITCCDDVGHQAAGVAEFQTRSRVVCGGAVHVVGRDVVAHRVRLHLRGTRVVRCGSVRSDVAVVGVAGIKILKKH